MKIKHVALSLITLSLLALWNSSRLYIAYKASGEINDQLPNLPIPPRSLSAPTTTSIHHSKPPAITTKRTFKPIATSSPPKPKLKPIVTPEPPKQETPIATATTSATTTSRGNKKPAFDVSNEPFGASFSACLKWMDDYRQLGEWLAYHYHVLPLRYLVFFRDPKSTTDPQPIFDKWADKIQVEYWTNNSDFMTEDQQKTIEKMTIDTKKHRRAQRFFYYSCIKHLYEKNRTWSILMDTDEYLILDSTAIPDVPERLLKPGAALDVLKKAQAKDPSIVNDKTPEKWFDNCTVMARKEYPAFESPNDKVTQNVPPGIMDPHRFVTLRFRHRGQKLIGKSMVDVSTLNFSKIRWKDVYSHNLFDSCTKGNNKGDLMYVGHYLGSMEAYQRPADRRNDWMNRTKKFYKLNAKSTKPDIGKGDMDVRPWIQGFAKSVGLEEMQYLLNDVGFPYNATTALQVLE